MSDFKCEVVPVVLETHPNAEKLSIVRVFDGYQVCVRTEDWKYLDKGIYIPPDSVVPDTEQFKFLEGHLRIKAKKLRGIESYGLLVPVPLENELNKSCIIGDDYSEYLGIKHYEPELSQMVRDAQGQSGDNPSIRGIIYDIEPWQKYRNEFIDGEEVVITEKIHGTNSRFSFQPDEKDNIPRMFCGSHNFWRKEGDNLYWNILKHISWVEPFCRLNPGVILYGEIFGAVQKGFHYGSTQANPYQFRAFDVFANGKFLDYDDTLGQVQSDFFVPLLYRGPYSVEKVQELVSGISIIPGAEHIREGIVIKPVKERYSERLRDRLILKFVSIDYLEGKKK
jgi:RNA ligase (TIGR02306 family)